MTRGDQGTHTKRDAGIEDRRRRKRKPERAWSPCYTKKGPGRRHVYGPGKKKLSFVTPDSTSHVWLNASRGKLPIQERENANARRTKVVTHGV